ncbi:MAG TPA: DUF3592 domain-containing protein [Anaerolineae bacterium]|nr:DUF3592 domain-containing protein [Anaerolineae bacterium]
MSLEMLLGEHEYIMVMLKSPFVMVLVMLAVIFVLFGRPRDLVGDLGYRQRLKVVGGVLVVGFMLLFLSSLSYFGVIVVVAGMVWVKRGWGAFVLGRASEGWPRAEGTIVASRGRYEKAPNHRFYQAVVRYEYEVEGVRHEGSTICFGRREWLFRQVEQRLITKYPQGSEVEVYYKPDEPSVAVLEPGVRLPEGNLQFSWGWGWLILGIGLIVLDVLSFGIRVFSNLAGLVM